MCVSPSQGSCCAPECVFRPRGQGCEEESDCKERSVCSGVSAMCPEPEAKHHMALCSLGTRVCLYGVSAKGGAGVGAWRLPWGNGALGLGLRSEAREEAGGKTSTFLNPCSLSSIQKDTYLLLTAPISSKTMTEFSSCVYDDDYDSPIGN